MARPGHSRNPVTLVVALLVVGALAWAVRGMASRSAAVVPPQPARTNRSGPSGAGGAPRPVLAASRACHDVGYLCAGLARSDTITIRHWKGFEGTIVIRVPRPSGVSATQARLIQQAAEDGIREWNGQPFPITVDERGMRPAEFAVQWTPALGGNRIGVAHTQWSRATGLRVLSLELVTHSPFDPERVVDPRQVLLTAAHEMGHALGLGHSDSPRDVMYPMNTASALTARDYRTMEALYSLPDGTEIVR